jgi:hypothetical protein
MKRMINMLSVAIILAACTPSEKPAEQTATPAAEPTVTLPYKAEFSAQWSDDVSDQDLLTVLNSYKAWENGDMSALRATLSDSVTFYGYDGFVFNGISDDLLKRWSSTRDSLSSVVITMDAWRKNHSIDRNLDYISVWYKEVDIHKDGRVDSAYWQDDNMVTNGKIRWYSQHRQKFPGK